MGLLKNLILPTLILTDEVIGGTALPGIPIQSHHLYDLDFNNLRKKFATNSKLATGTKMKKTRGKTIKDERDRTLLVKVNRND